MASAIGRRRSTWRWKRSNASRPSGGSGARPGLLLRPGHGPAGDRLDQPAVVTRVLVGVREGEGAERGVEALAAADVAGDRVRVARPRVRLRQHESADGGE